MYLLPGGHRPTPPSTSRPHVTPTSSYGIRHHYKLQPDVTLNRRWSPTNNSSGHYIHHQWSPTSTCLGPNSCPPCLHGGYRSKCMPHERRINSGQHHGHCSHSPRCGSLPNGLYLFDVLPTGLPAYTLLRWNLPLPTIPHQPPGDRHYSFSHTRDEIFAENFWVVSVG